MEWFFRNLTFMAFLVVASAAHASKVDEVKECVGALNDAIQQNGHGLVAVQYLQGKIGQVYGANRNDFPKSLASYRGSIQKINTCSLVGLEQWDIDLTMKVYGGFIGENYADDFKQCYALIMHTEVALGTQIGAERAKRVGYILSHRLGKSYAFVSAMRPQSAKKFEDVEKAALAYLKKVPEMNDSDAIVQFRAMERSCDILGIPAPMFISGLYRE